MEKPNDFLAAQLNAPDNFTLIDFYSHGLTPDNTGLKDKDYYKNIKQVQDTFTNSAGVFDDAKFNDFYESVLRSYNEWATTDFADNFIKHIARSPENFQQMDNPNVRDTSTKLFQANDPWRHQRGFGNLYEVGKESYDVREVAQENYVRDSNGNILDWTPNDKGGIIKGLFRNPMALATDENGQYLLDDEGNPFYRELKDGESIRGKELLHYTDTLTKEDSWLNKFDLFDNDSLDKSIGGTLTKTLVTLAPYLIPGVYQTLGTVGAIYNLAKSVPFIAKIINGGITNNSDATEFGKTMNNWEAFFSKFDTSKSRHAMDHQWSVENIGQMVIDSAKQLAEQRTFTRIPELLKLDAAQVNPEIFGTLSIGYMALTSSTDSLNTFKNAGMSDRSAAIASLAYTGALFKLMNKDYFKSWLFKNKWVNSRPEITNSLKENSKAAASIMEKSIKNATAKNPKLLTIEAGASKEEAQSLFKTVWNATKEAWNNKSIDPFRNIDITLPGSVNAGNVYVHHALNEGIEETMEEFTLDTIKLTALALDSLGINVEEDEKNLDFGLSWSDVAQRYSTAFVGGAIGGAVFQGMDDWHTKVLNNNLSNVTGRGLNGELIKNIRLYGEDAVLKELKRLRDRGVLGNKNLVMKGQWTKDPSDETKQIWTWNESGDAINQNDYVYNVMKVRIQTLANIMQDENLLMNDNEILKQIQTDIKSKAEAENLSEEAYMKRHNILPFDEFAQKTGFADIVLTDVGNLTIDIVQTEEAIEARKADLSSKIPDTRSSERDSVISKDPVIKQLEKLKKDYKEQLESIESGNAASYYIRYANFVSHDSLVSSLLTAEGNSTLDKEAFAYWKYRTTYSEAGDNLKPVIDKDYEEYVKLKGLGALESANSLYQHAVDLAKPLIQQQQSKFKQSHINPTVFGNYVENTDSMNTSTILNRDGWSNIEQIISALRDPNLSSEDIQREIKNATFLRHEYIDTIFNKRFNKEGEEYTLEKKYDDILTLIAAFYKDVDQTKQLAYGADDWVKYALNRIKTSILSNSKKVLNKIKDIANDQDILKLSETLSKADKFDNITYANIFENVQNPDIQELTSKLRTIPYSEDENDENGELTEQSVIRRDLFDYVQQEKQAILDRNNILRDNSSDFSTAKQLFDSALSKLDTSPEEAIVDFEKLREFINSPNVADDFKEDVANAFSINGFSKVANGLMPIIETVRNRAESPAIELAKAISFDLTGQENSVLDLIEAQKGILSSKTRASEFILPQSVRLDLEVAEKVMPIVQSVLWAAANGINEEANKMLITEGKENLLPTIDPDLWYIYKQDLQFFQNQIDFMIRLTDQNLNAKPRENILVRSNFYKHIVDFINTEDADGESVETLKSIQRAIGDFDLVESATRLGLLSLDYDDQSKEAQTKIKIAFQNFEHEIWEHVKSKKLDYYTVGKDISYTFNDSWKIKNGVLSPNFKDGLSNTDISNYFISVVGYDSYKFSKKLKSRFEGTDKFPYFGQELAIRLILAELEHSELSNGSVDGMVESLERAVENGNIKVDPNQPNINKDIEYLRNRVKLYNTTIIDGYAGVGKSTMIFATAMSFFKDAEVVGISKIKSRADALGLDSDHTFDINSFMTECLGEPYSDSEFLKSEGFHTYAWKNKDKKLNLSKLFSDSSDKKVIVIDECTLVKSGVWDAICSAAKEQNIHIVGLGNLMQIGETSAGLSANIDDCIGTFSTKLTVSMRDANVGKTLNNQYVGNVVNELISAKRENPNFGEFTITSQNPTGQIVLKYFVDKDGKLYGDKIVADISDSEIEALINAKDETETITIVTPNDTFNALREKYKTDETVNFVPVEDVQGSESDYVILNHDFNNDPRTKFTTMQSFYTLLTRAKKGTLIKNSDGLKELLLVSDKEDSTASVNTGYDINSVFAKEYRESWLDAANAIPEESTEPEEVLNPKNDSEKETSKETKEELEEVFDDLEPKEPVPLDELLEEVEKEEDGDAEITDNNESGDQQLGIGLRGERLKAYKLRKSLLSNADVALSDQEDFVNWLDEQTSFGELSGISKWNQNKLNDFRTFLRGLSSIIMNNDKESWYEKFRTRSKNIKADAIIDYAPGMISALGKALNSKDESLFFKQVVSDEHMLLYYCFDEYALPICLYKPANGDPGAEGLCKVTFKQETPIIPITSRGEVTNSVKSVLPKSISIAQNEGNPITAIFTVPENISYEKIYRNEMFVKSAGKAIVMMLTEFGMTDDEIKKLFEAEVNEENIITYFLKNDINAYAIAGVQEKTAADDFMNVLGIIDKFLRNGVGNDESANRGLEVIGKFFGIHDPDEIKRDFALITSIDTGANIAENAKRYGDIRKKYNILYTREIDLFITGLFAYFQNAENANQEQFTNNIFTNFLKFYYNWTNADEKRRQGFKFSLRDDLKNDYNFYIVPTQNNERFQVYYCGTEYNADSSNPIGEIKYNDLVWVDKKIKFTLENIVEQLLSNDKIKNQINSIHPDFEVSNINSLLRSGKISLSLTTGIEHDGNIEFYPPFESRILQLTDGTNLGQLSDFLAKSTLFKRGIYRQISKQNISIDKEGRWSLGNVEFDNLSWDIRGVLTPIFSVKYDDEHDLELSSKYKKLFTPKNSNDIKIKTDNRIIHFEDAEGNYVNGMNDEIREYIKKKTGEEVNPTLILKSIELTDSGIKFEFKSASGNKSISIDYDEQGQNVLQKLLAAYDGGSTIDYTKLHRYQTIQNDVLIDGENYTVISVDGGRYYQLERNGDRFNFRKIGQSTTSTEEFIYILSKDLFGQNIKRFKVDDTSPLYNKNTNIDFIGYVDIDTSGSKILYFIDKSGRITALENSKEIPLNRVSVRESGVILETNDDKKLQHVLPLDNIIPEYRRKFTLDFSKTSKIKRGKNVWNFIGDNSVSFELLRRISSYNSLESNGGNISKIDFKNNKIRINNVDYDLQADKATIEALFTDFEEFVNFEKRFKTLLSKYESILPDINKIINNLNNSDDPLFTINSYLEENLDRLKRHLSVIITESGDLGLAHTNEKEDFIINEILKTNPDLEFSKFNVILNGNDAKIEYDGNRFMIAKLKGEDITLKVDLYVDDGTVFSKDDVINRINEIKELDPTLEDYANVILTKLNGIALSRGQLSLLSELISVYNNKLSTDNALLNELATLNKELPKYCKV